MIIRSCIVAGLLLAGPALATEDDGVVPAAAPVIVVDRPFAVAIGYPAVRATTTVRTPPIRRAAPEHAPAILAAAHANGVNPRLLSAVIQVESASRAWALSPKGARGLMQIMPSTARSVGVSNADDLFDPAVNIAAGARHLRQLHGKFPSLRLVLAAYNSGEAAVRRYGGIPPYAETTAYVARVLARYRAMGGRA